MATVEDFRHWQLATENAEPEWHAGSMVIIDGSVFVYDGEKWKLYMGVDDFGH